MTIVMKTSAQISINAVMESLSNISVKVIMKCFATHTHTHIYIYVCVCVNDKTKSLATYFNECCNKKTFKYFCECYAKKLGHRFL